MIWLELYKSYSSSCQPLTTSIILSSNKVQNRDILLQANPVPPGTLKWRVKTEFFEPDVSFHSLQRSYLQCSTVFCLFFFSASPFSIGVLLQSTWTFPGTSNHKVRGVPLPGTQLMTAKLIHSQTNKHLTLTLQTFHFIIYNSAVRYYYTVFHKIGTPSYFCNNFFKCWSI